MSRAKEERELREGRAREAVKRSHGTEEGEYGATLFVSHHLEELDSAYWQEHFDTESPEPGRVLSILQVQPHVEEEDDLGTLDFVLPGEVSDYLLCVQFDGDGAVVDISMES